MAVKRAPVVNASSALVRRAVESVARGVVRGSDVLRFLGRKARIQLSSRASLRQSYIEHYGIHHPRNNAGDAVLFQAIEDLFDFAYGKQAWHRASLRRVVSPRDVSRINRGARAVLVGGGGLLMAADRAVPESGWQWRISREYLSHIDVPLIMFAVGYNQFRDSAEFSPIFDEHLRATVDKSGFFGVRNTGSMEHIRARLPPSLQDRVVFQPCMTTILRKFLPACVFAGHARFSKRVAFNLAFDRADGRYGADRDAILARINAVVDWALDTGWEVTVVLQAWEDEPVVSALRRRGGGIRFERLTMASPEKVIRFYANMPVTVGMRGHAQMIPFGCGSAIFSLVSHDKMRFFLEDIRRPEWGIDIRDRELTDKTIAFLSALEDSWEDVTRHVAAQQARLWSVTCSNLLTVARSTNFHVAESVLKSARACS